MYVSLSLDANRIIAHCWNMGLPVRMHMHCAGASCILIFRAECVWNLINRIKRSEYVDTQCASSCSSYKHSRKKRHLYAATLYLHSFATLLRLRSNWDLYWIDLKNCQFYSDRVWSWLRVLYRHCESEYFEFCSILIDLNSMVTVVYIYHKHTENLLTLKLNIIWMSMEFFLDKKHTILRD